MTLLINIAIHTSNTAIKIRPVDVKSSTYIDFGIENNEKDY